VPTHRCNVCLDRFQEPGHYTADERQVIRLVTRDFISGNGSRAHLCRECIDYFTSALRRKLGAARPVRRAPPRVETARLLTHARCVPSRRRLESLASRGGPRRESQPGRRVPHPRRCVMQRTSVPAMIAAALLLAATAQAGIQLGPRAGYYKALDADEGRFFGGVAARWSPLPGFALEGAADYHAEEPYGEDLTVRTIPLTVSVALDVIPMIYVAGGVGWYMTRYDWDSAGEDKSTRDFGYQFGGGLDLHGPSGPHLVADLRYHALDDERFEQTVEDMKFDKVDPDFWSATIAVLFPLR
jgi:hypothetical protein